jgi:hypothetical protein
MKKDTEQARCFYSDQNLEIVLTGFIRADSSYNRANERLHKISALLNDGRAKEYLLHGAARRLRLIKFCIDKAFSIYPPQRMETLSDDEQTTLCIHLQSFFANLFGLLDNLAWVVNFEKQLNVHRNQVGLYTKDLQKHLSKDFNDYLNSARTLDWHLTHLKEFRDSLGHRIPVYMVPYGIDC